MKHKPFLPAGSTPACHSFSHTRKCSSTDQILSQLAFYKVCWCYISRKEDWPQLCKQQGSVLPAVGNGFYCIGKHSQWAWQCWWTLRCDNWGVLIFGQTAKELSDMRFTASQKVVNSDLYWCYIERKTLSQPKGNHLVFKDKHHEAYTLIFPRNSQTV